MDYGSISNFENISPTSNYTSQLPCFGKKLNLEYLLRIPMYLFLARVEKPGESVEYSVI